MKRQRSGVITLRYLTSIRVFFLIVAGLLVWGAWSEFSTGSPLTKVAWAVVALVGIMAAQVGEAGDDWLHGATGDPNAPGVAARQHLGSSAESTSRPTRR